MRTTTLLLASALLMPACGGAEPRTEPDPRTEPEPAALSKGDACAADDECGPQALCRAGDVCTGPLDALAFQTECTTEAADLCPGLVCIGLVDNAQAKTGICSLPCESDATCGAGAACVALTVGRSYCLHLCETSADCAHGFVCVDDPEGRGRACLVDPV